MSVFSAARTTHDSQLRHSLGDRLASPHSAISIFHCTVGRGGHLFAAMLQAGIVGLPNVGKSTLFNALTRTRKAESANYPFCTIDPNVGVVQVPDARLEPLREIAKTDKVIPAAIEFVDIAGLVEGASKGEGLGNKFLANIREVDAIVHVCAASIMTISSTAWAQSTRSATLM